MEYMKIISVLMVIGMVLAGPAPKGHCFSIKGPEKTLEAPVYRIRGADYLPLPLVCDAYGLKWEWDPASMTAALSKGSASMRLRVGEYKIAVNGILNVQERPVVLHKGAVCVPSDFLKLVFDRLFAAGRRDFIADAGLVKTPPQSSPPQFHKIKKIIIDAGHGGYDPGAISRDGVKEKFITLDIARRVKDELERKNIEVVMTRHADEFVSLQRRVDAANRSGADLFVSIHANASRTPRLKGFEVYYLSEAVDDNARAQASAENRFTNFDGASAYTNSDTLNTILWDLELTENRRQAIELSNSILDNIDVRKRGIRNARFFVLKGTRMPAVLVEVGYISNKDECLRLCESNYRARISDRVARGIIEYKRMFESTGGFIN